MAVPCCRVENRAIPGTISTRTGRRRRRFGANWSPNWRGRQGTCPSRRQALLQEHDRKGLHICRTLAGSEQGRAAHFTIRCTGHRFPYCNSQCGRFAAWSNMERSTQKTCKGERSFYKQEGKLVFRRSMPTKGCMQRIPLPCRPRPGVPVRSQLHWRLQSRSSGGPRRTARYGCRLPQDGSQCYSAGRR